MPENPYPPVPFSAPTPTTWFALTPYFLIETTDAGEHWHAITKKIVSNGFDGPQSLLFFSATDGLVINLHSGVVTAEPRFSQRTMAGTNGPSFRLSIVAGRRLMGFPVNPGQEVSVEPSFEHSWASSRNQFGKIVQPDAANVGEREHQVDDSTNKGERPRTETDAHRCAMMLASGSESPARDERYWATLHSISRADDCSRAGRANDKAQSLGRSVTGLRPLPDLRGSGVVNGQS